MHKCLLIITITVNAVTLPVPYTTYVQQQYNNLLGHIHLIKKCYWQRIPCTPEEKAMADRLVQIGLLGGGALALAGGYKGIGLMASRYQMNRAKNIIKRIIPNAQKISIVPLRYPNGDEREQIIVTVPYMKEIEAKQDMIIQELTKHFPGKGLNVQAPNGVIFTLLK